MSIESNGFRSKWLYVSTELVGRSRSVDRRLDWTDDGKVESTYSSDHKIRKRSGMLKKWVVMDNAR